MANQRPFSAVLRLGDVAISKTELETRVGTGVERFQAQRSGGLNYAQVNIPEGDDIWSQVMDTARVLGPPLAELRLERAIGVPVLDFAFGFPPEFVTRTSWVPSSVAEALGRAGIDIEISTYPADNLSP